MLFHDNARVFTICILTCTSCIAPRNTFRDSLGYDICCVTSCISRHIVLNFSPMNCRFINIQRVVLIPLTASYIVTRAFRLDLMQDFSQFFFCYITQLNKFYQLTVISNFSEGELIWKFSLYWSHWHYLHSNLYILQPRNTFWDSLGYVMYSPNSPRSSVLTLTA